MLDADEGTVCGEAMTFPDIQKALARLDRLEGYRSNDSVSSHYLRIAKPVRLIATGEEVDAWVYVYPESRCEELRHNGTLIEHGDWIRFIQTQR